MVRSIVLCVAVVFAACGDRSGPPPPGDAARVTRVFEKPRRGVRAVPPHAIRTEGVGPYLLGTSLKSLLSLTGRRPRVELMELDGVVEYSLVRTENETVIMGVSRGVGLSFITVVDEKIARTERGVGVGAELEELEEAVGAHRVELDRLRDPRVHVFAELPNVRFVVEDDEVIAVSVSVEDQPRPPAAPTKSAPVPPAPPVAKAPERPCTFEPLEKASNQLLAVDRSRRAEVSYGCLDDEPFAVVTAGERVSAVTGPPDKPRRLRIATLPGLVFAGALDTGDDGQDEVIAVTRQTTAVDVRWSVEVFRYEGSRFARVSGREVYSIARASAPLIGSGVADIELLLDFRAHDDVLSCGGLLLQRGAGGRGGVVNAAPLVAKKLIVSPRRTSPRKPQANAADAGAGAGADGRGPVDAGIPRKSTKKKP